MVNQPVNEQVDDTEQHPLHTLLINLVLIFIVIGAKEHLEVHYRIKREDDIRRHKKVGKPVPRRDWTFLVLQIVQVDSQPKHKHGGQNGEDGTSPIGHEQIRAKSRKHTTSHQEQRHPCHP